MTPTELLDMWETNLKVRGFIFSENSIEKTMHANLNGVRVASEKNTDNGRGNLYAQCYQFLSLRKKVKGQE